MIGRTLALLLILLAFGLLSACHSSSNESSEPATWLDRDYKTLKEKWDQYARENQRYMPTKDELKKRNQLINQSEAYLRDGTIRRISNGRAVYPLKLFFEGNYDHQSIAPNQWAYGRPPNEVMYEIFQAIENRKEVARVWIEVRAAPLPDDSQDFDMWLEGDQAFIVTTADRDTVDQWVRVPLEITEVLKYEHTELDEGKFKTYVLIWD